MLTAKQLLLCFFFFYLETSNCEDKENYHSLKLTKDNQWTVCMRGFYDIISEMRCILSTTRRWALNGGIEYSSFPDAI